MRYRLEFNYDFAGNQQINPLPLYNMPFVIDAYFNLSLKIDLSESQFHTQRLFVDRFQKPRPQHSMNFNGRANYPFRQLIIYGSSSVFSVTSVANLTLPLHRSL